MERKTRTWTHPATGKSEIVEIDSPRDKELMQKLRDIGLIPEGEPGYEDGISMDEYLKTHEQGPDGKIRKKK